MEAWPVLTADNCFIIVLHSHPMGDMVRRQKKTESRPRKVHRHILVFASAKIDSPALPWDTDRTIKPNTIYCVGWVNNISEGVYASYDWELGPLIVLPVPVDLKGVAIGRNGGGHVSPREEHACAMKEVNDALCMFHLVMSGRGKSKVFPLSTKSWETYTEGKQLDHPTNNIIIAITKVAKIPEVRHKTWDMTMEANDIVIAYATGDSRQVLSHPPSFSLSLSLVLSSSLLLSLVVYCCL